AEAFEAADSAMRDREHGKWKDFYANDCLTDVKETAYCLKRLMGYMRNLGDGPDFYKWQREVTYSENDCKVVLITNIGKSYDGLGVVSCREKQTVGKKQIVGIFVTIT
ncbi:hypothetical protein OBE_15731, partial [human gut metagenome]